MKSIIFLAFFVLSSSVLAHSRLKFPPPRSNSDGLKLGPCGGLPPSASPTSIQGGRNLTVTWEETINHPGRFLFSLSSGKDNFQSSPLLEVQDDQGADVPTPHEFSAQVPIPDINCDTCTLQLIQSMEENPQAPTYYYSCADVKISATGSGTSGPSTSLPGGGRPGDVRTQDLSSSSAWTKAKFGGGCGAVRSVHPPGGGGWYMILVPFLFGVFLRLQLALRWNPLKLRHKPSQRK